jgi:choice-of-anchor B domain-containing protein
MPARSLAALAFLVLALLVPASGARAGSVHKPPEEDPEALPQLEPLGGTPCVGGMAGPYPCSNVDLMSFTPVAAMGCGATNDIWGWTDPLTSREYALVGCNNGTSFVDVTVPDAPVYLGRLPTHTSNSSWRDLEVYNNHVFIGSEAGGHGMQVFNLTQLRNVVNPPVTFSATAHYAGFGNSHTINVNTATGFAYAVGTTSTASCPGGLNMVNIQNPAAPVSAGCWAQQAARGYVHDTHCVIYHGPDVAHQGREICLASNPTTSGGSGVDRLTIVDVTTKPATVELSSSTYPGSAFIHQGWLTEDHQYFLVDDELDETGSNLTRTHMWDVRNLDAPVWMGFFEGTTPAIDHQQFIKGNYAYQSNYRAGLRILNVAGVAMGQLNEVGYFDVFPSSNSANFNGTWANYPFFTSGNVIVASIGEGLFVVRPRINADFNLLAARTTMAACTTGSDAVTFSVTPQDNYTGNVTLSTTGLPSGASGGFSVNPVTVPGTSLFTVTTAGAPAGDHPFTVTGTDGTLTHNVTMTLRVAAASPGVPALSTPAAGAGNQPLRPTFTWSAVPSAVTYSLQVATDAAFANVVAAVTGIVGTTHTLTADLEGNRTHYWRVLAVNGCGAGTYSAARYFTTRAEAASCPLGTSPAVGYTEGFEAGAPGWTHSGTGDTWASSTFRVHSGVRSFAAQAPPSVTDQRLVSPAIVLPAGQLPVTLQFWNHQTLELGAGGFQPPSANCIDGAILEISTDGGTNWTRMESQLLTDPYDGPVAAGTGNPLAGVNAWCGDPQDWLLSVASLDAYAGQSVRFRFRLGTNNSVAREGWYLDDVAIQSCVPNPTPTLSIDDVRVGEDNGHGPGRHPNNGIFTVTLSAPWSQTVSVNYATVPGTAQPGADYTPVSGTVLIPPGFVAQTIDVPVLSDTLREPNEYFFVDLSGPSGAGMSDARGQGMIEGSPLGDFNADDRQDLLWLHDAAAPGGRIVVWFMNGTTLTSGTFTNPASLPDASWRIDGTGDFNGDLNTDFLWRHRGSGEIVAWYMNGTSLGGGTFFNPPALPDLGWRAVAAAEFNGDGRSDILWHHATSGQVAVWFMNGVVLSGGTLTTPEGLPDPQWSLVATGDFNRDGQTDLLWRHSGAGQIAVWFMEGTVLRGGTFTTPPALADPQWSIAATGDYNGDGDTDIVWRHGTSGQIVAWFMHGTTLESGTFTTPPALTDTAWKIVGPR